MYEIGIKVKNIDDTLKPLLWRYRWCHIPKHHD